MRSSASNESATISRFLLLLKFVRCYSPCHIHAASVEIKCFNAPLEIISDIGVQLFLFLDLCPTASKDAGPPLSFMVSCLVRYRFARW